MSESGAGRRVPSRIRLSTRRVVLALLQRVFVVVSAVIPSKLLQDSRVARLRSIFLATPAAEVIRVVDRLDDADVQWTILGGWGVDALLGKQTRRHRDLDLIVPARDDQISRVNEALTSLGYRFLHDEVVSTDLLVHRIVWQNGLGRTVDIHPATVELDAMAGLTGPGRKAEGTISGRRVHCLTPEVQLALHARHRPRNQDDRDVARLCSRFGLAPPSGYWVARDLDQS